MNPDLRWALMNLALPLSPFLLRSFIAVVGPQGSFSLSSIAELPELLFYSVFVCVALLNLNLDRQKTNFESLLRLFLMVLLVLDFVTLALIYGTTIGPHVWKFTVFAALIPALMALPYRRVYVSAPTDG